MTIALLGMSLLLLGLAFVLPRPGLPVSLKADEPAYLLAALSLARDGDLRCETQDLEWLFADFPYVIPRNVILASNDGWHTLTFGKPYLYSLLAAPLVAVAGINGMFACNVLLFLAMVWMGTNALRRFNDDATAALFACGFFFLSTAFVYVFWLHPEIFLMATGMACLYFGLRTRENVKGREVIENKALAKMVAPFHGPFAKRVAPFVSPTLSGFFLACAVYHKPMMAAFGLPVLVFLARRRRWGGALAWLVSVVATLALAAAGSQLLAGYPSAYLVEHRAGFTVTTPYQPPVEPIAPAPETTGADVATADGEDDARGAGWWWLVRVPELPWNELRENATYFFVGRHTGLFLYQPFALIALGLFLIHGRRSLERWLVLAALALIAAFFLVWIPFNWHGGGGFVGNRYFVMAYPGFLFLVTRVRPAWTLLAGYAVGGLLLGPLVLAPFGAIVPQGTLQAHARNRPFQLFPHELSLREIPGQTGVTFGDVYFLGRRDQVKVDGDTLWTQGSDRVELWLQSAEPLERLVLDVFSRVPENSISLELEDARVEIVAGPEPRRVILEPSRPHKMRQPYDPRTARRYDVYVYRLVVEARDGERPSWRGEPARFFYFGAGLVYRDPRAPSDPAPDAPAANVAESEKRPARDG